MKTFEYFIQEAQEELLSQEELNALKGGGPLGNEDIWEPDLD